MAVAVTLPQPRWPHHPLINRMVINMKIIIYLPLLTSALLLGWYLFGGNTPTSPDVVATPLPTEHSAAVAPSQPVIPMRAAPPQVPDTLPASVRGTDVDGQLETDSRGNLVVTSQLRHLFDYFLSLVGEEEPAIALQRIRAYLAGQLGQPALGQAHALLDSYLDYQRQVTDLESRFPVSEVLDDLLAREQAVQQLRAALFSREAHGAFFAGEEIYNTFTLERLMIARDDALNELQKAEAIEALRENLPEEMQQLLVPQIQNDLREQTIALREAGAGEDAIRELRMGVLGPDATGRLEELDQHRTAWRQRVKAFNQERDAILAETGLAEHDRQAAVNALVQEQFTETERLRLGATSSSTHH